MARATRHAASATSQENQRTDQQQREEQIPEQTQRRRSGARGVYIKADALLLEGVDQLRSQARQINAKALNAVVNFGINRFHNGIPTAVIDVDSCNPTCFHVIQETAIAHAADGRILRSDGWTTRIEALKPPVTDQLPTQKQRDADG